MLSIRLLSKLTFSVNLPKSGLGFFVIWISSFLIGVCSGVIAGVVIIYFGFGINAVIPIFAFYFTYYGIFYWDATL